MASRDDAAPRVLVPSAAAPRKARLASWWLLLLFTALSVGLYHNYLSGGFVLDDLIIVGWLRQHPAPGPEWLHLWSFTSKDNPAQNDLWWADPTASIRFFRPLPSLLLSTWYRAFGPGALPLHLLSILLHALAAFTTFRLFDVLSGRRAIALLAGALFLASGRVMTVGWISAMPDIPCVIFINLALVAHLHWRATGGAARRVGSLLCLVLALMCKESAAVAPLGILLLEWVLGRAEGDSRVSMIKRSWPALAIFVAFGLAYVLLDLGDTSNLLYLNPISQTRLYLPHAAMALPVLLAAALTIMRTPALGWPPQLREKSALVGITAALLLVWALKPLWRHASVRWSAGFFVLQLLPQTATEPGPRLLYCSLVPLNFLLAMLIAAAFPRFFREEMKDGVAPANAPQGLVERMPLVTRAWGVYALIGLSLAGYARSYYGTKRMIAAMHIPEQRIAPSVIMVGEHLQQNRHLTVVILNTGGPQPTLYAGGAYSYHYGKRVTTRVLSSLDGPATLERIGPRSFVISTDQPGWLTGHLSRIVRRDPRLSVGQRFRTPLFEAEVLRLTPDGADVLSVAFTFHEALNRRDLLFLAWDGRGIAPFDLAGLGLHHAVSLDGSVVARPAARQ